MSATIDANANPFREGDRIRMSEKSSMFPNMKGTVQGTFLSTTTVRMDNAIILMLHFSNLVKLKTKTAVGA